MKPLAYLLLALTAGLSSCAYDEAVELCHLQLQLTYQSTAFAEPTGASVRVELRDSHAQVFVDSTDANKTANFIVPPGLYEASTSSQYIDSTDAATRWRYMFNGTKSMIVVSPDSLNQVEMPVRVSRKRIVI